MKVALIFPTYAHKIFTENLSTVDEEFCVAPPIILAYVAAILEKHGHAVMLLDAKALTLSKEEALKRFVAFEPDILGFRAETYYFHEALDWIRYLKAHLGVPVIAGGINLTLYPLEVLSHPEIDYGIIGEAFESLPRFLSALENGDDYSRLSGVAYKDDENKVVINPPEHKVYDFDLYPYPARHLLPNDKYYSFVSQRKNFTIMLTSTGCPYGCLFCAIPFSYRVRTPENVVDEIEVCYQDFGVREIDFFDAVLFMPRERIREIFRLIQRRKLDIEWSARSRIDVVDEQLLKEAARAGCRQIYYGIESADQQILDSVKKGIQPKAVIETIKISKKFGIRTMGFFMVGNPGETKESVRKTIEFSKTLGLDFIQVSRTIPKPGTELDNAMMKVSMRDYWRMHVQGEEIAHRLPTPWVNLTEQEKESLAKEFYIKFYFRPRIIAQRILQLRSWEEFIMYIRVALKIIFQKSELSLRRTGSEIKNYE